MHVRFHREKYCSFQTKHGLRPMLCTCAPKALWPLRPMLAVDCKTNFVRILCSVKVLMILRKSESPKLGAPIRACILSGQFRPLSFFAKKNSGILFQCSLFSCNPYPAWNKESILKQRKSFWNKESSLKVFLLVFYSVRLLPCGIVLISVCVFDQYSFCVKLFQL
jgi:hypothetical protein